MSGFEALKNIKLMNEKERQIVLEQERLRKEKKQSKANEKLKNTNLNDQVTKEQTIPTNNQASNVYFISFLGTILADSDEKKAFYNASRFDLLDIESKKYHNTTQIILEQIKNNNNFKASFYATDHSLKIQNTLIEKYKNYLERIKIIFYEPSNYNALYEMLLEDISECESEMIIIDITHGFRDNVFLSILAGLMQINIKPKIKIKFIIAKELEKSKNYELINLDEYLENMIMSSVLSIFKQSLKVPNYYINNDLYDCLCALSDSLFTNFFMDIKECYIDFKKESEKLKQSKDFNLKPLLDEILKDFSFIDNWTARVEHKQFYDLACLYFKHYYPANAAQFLIEGVFLYMSERLNTTFNSVKKERDINQIASDILIKVQDNKQNPLDIINKIEKEAKIKQVFARCIKELEKINIKLDISEKQFIGLLKLRKLWDKIKDIRNPMSHCTTENNKFDINKELTSCLDMFKAHIIENDVLNK